MPWVSDVHADIGDDSATLYSPAPRFGQFCAALVATVVVVVALAQTFGSGPYIAIVVVVLGAITAALSAYSKSFQTKFDRTAGDVTVETRSVCRHSVQKYRFAEIDALAVTENCVVELQLRNGTTRRLTYAHETFPQLDKMIGSLCLATGIPKGSPNVVRAPFQDDRGVLSEQGMGLYVESRFAILASSDKFLSFRWLVEIVFNRERREMTVIWTTPLRKRRVLIPMQEVSSIGLEGKQDPEDGTLSYRAVIRLNNGRSIRLFGKSPRYERYEQILAKVRDLTGIAKRDYL